MNWSKLLFIIIAICFSPSLVAQQDSVLLTKNFQFEDGIYFDLKQLQTNQPDITWDAVQSNLFTNPQTFLTKVDFIHQASDTLDLSDIYALVLGGIPYVHVEKNQNGLHTFAGLRVRGKICYYRFERKEEQLRTISAFNPLTGKAFRTATIPKTVTITEERIMDFESGTVRSFDKKNLLDWIADDTALVASIKELSPQEVDKKLFKCLLIYVDRHPYYLTVSER